jgi:hypothetical protein
VRKALEKDSAQRYASAADMRTDRQSMATIHNFRNCDYYSELDYTCAWLTKTVYLSQLRGIDL